MTTDLEGTFMGAEVTEEAPSILAHIPDIAQMEQDAHRRMNAAVTRCVQAGGPQFYPLAIAVEAVSRLCIEKGVFTRLEVMNAQAEFADQQFDAMMRAKITQDVASGLMKPN